jgi:hypothetical protein
VVCSLLSLQVFVRGVWGRQDLQDWGIRLLTGEMRKASRRRPEGGHWEPARTLTVGNEGEDF